MSGMAWRALVIAPVSRFARVGPLVLGLMLALSSPRAHAAVQAWLDTNQVAPGDSVQLTLEYEGQTSSEPDLSPLERDFDVLGSNRVTTFEILNGNTSAKTQLAVTLSPKHAGRLAVPSILWGGQRSPPLALDVSASAGSGGIGSTGRGAGGGHGQPTGAATQSRQVFLETEFGPAQPYVQAAVTVTVRLYTREALYDPSITFSGTHDVVVRQVGSDDDGSVPRGGESYEVVTRHYVVFPQRSGRLSLPGPVLDARVAVGHGAESPFNDPFAGLLGAAPFAGGMLSSVKPIRLHGDPIALDVRPRPAGAVGSYWMPASEVTLQSDWEPATLQAHAGDPVTADLSLQAVGLTAAQLPDLSQLIALPAGLRSYPDQAKLSDTARGNAVIGTREQSIALIADQPGHFTIPALRLQWWDTGSNQAREITLPARTLIVTPAASTAVSAQSAPAPKALASVPSRSAPAPASAAGSEPAAASARPSPSVSPSAAIRATGASGAPQGAHLLSGRASVWLGVSAALALGWLVTLGAWLRLRRRAAAALAPGRVSASETGSSGAAVSAPGAASSSASRAAFRLACQRNEAAGARRHLLAWVRAAWPAPAPAGLNALARQIEDPSLAALIRELDRVCYTGEPWRGDSLGAALTDLPRRESRRDDRSSDLSPLYP
jgi:hypothetical protein